VERYGLPKLPFYFIAVCLSIRKQFIPEQLMTATYALTLFVFASVLKRKILSPRKGNATTLDARRSWAMAGPATIEYRGKREATAVLFLRECRAGAVNQRRCIGMLY
jgi:hypothetical protein